MWTATDPDSRSEVTLVREAAVSALCKTGCEDLINPFSLASDQ